MDEPTAADSAAVAPPTARVGLFALRREIPRWLAVLLGALCIAVVFGIWHFLTRGEVEERILSPVVLPSVAETFDKEKSIHRLFVERDLRGNLLASLRRVATGFGLAAAIGVPLGVLCGCFPWFNAFLAPVTIFGRNIPIAALIPLTFSFFGIGEFQKVMFIFIACVAFVISDTARAIADVDQRYIDTAYTLGAKRRQIILKVLVPLALPSIFNSLRLLFGLAFGYIMLAELVKFGGESGGLGEMINTSQRLRLRTHVLLILMIIPIVALTIDRVLYWIQRSLFPHEYGGNGWLLKLTRVLLHGWEDFKGIFFSPAEYAHAAASPEAAAPRSTEAAP